MESDIASSNKNMIWYKILCFLQCKYGIVPKLTTRNTLFGFYDVDVICSAKKNLYENFILL